MKNNSELRKHAREMRMAGESLIDIKNKLGKPKGTVWYWIKDLPAPEFDRTKMADKQWDNPNRKIPRAPKAITVVKEKIITKSPMAIDRSKMRNNQHQGSLGVAAAVAWFTANDYVVSIPMCDTKRYDIIVEDAVAKLLKVECKTSTCFNEKTESWEIALKTCGGNQSWNGTIKKISKEDSDLIFALCGDGMVVLIPTEDVHGQTQVNVSLKNKNAKYIVSW